LRPFSRSTKGVFESIGVAPFFYDFHI